MVSGKHYSGAHLPLPIVAGVDGVARLDDGASSTPTPGRRTG